MKQRWIAIGCAATVIMLSGTASAQGPKDEKGMQIFKAQKCTQCHSVAGVGNKKGTLDEIGSKMTAAQIKEWIVDPEGSRAKAQPPPTRKPFMKKVKISDGDLDALVQFLSGLKKP
jgi:hypothetical protein